jgi:hypothetical protein
MIESPSRPSPGAGRHDHNHQTAPRGRLVTALITALAALIAAALTAWRWGWDEWRKQPAIDGDISVTILPSGPDVVFAQIDSVWNNRSPLPIYLDPGKCVIRICELRSATPPQSIGTDAIPMLEIFPVRHAEYFMLEPGTASRIQATAALKRGPLYEATADIRLDKDRHLSRLWRQQFDPKIYWWSRRRIFASEPADDGEAVT